MRFIHKRLSAGTALLTAAALLLLSSAALAQRFFFRGEGRDPDVRNIRYDGRFTFARLKYRTGPGGYWYQGLPAWAHGYPLSEDKLERLMTAHDTGGAIRGVVRADFYWGGGPEAGNLAGRMRQQGKMWLLWPRGEPLPKGEAAAPRFD